MMTKVRYQSQNWLKLLDYLDILEQWKSLMIKDKNSLFTSSANTQLENNAG